MKTRCVKRKWLFARFKESHELTSLECPENFHHQHLTKFINNINNPHNYKETVQNKEKYKV